jgi:hypothetical protein
MPFDDLAVPGGLALQRPEELPIDVPSAPFNQQFDAFMRRGNIVGSITEAASQPPMSPFDPNYDMWSKIVGTKYEPFASAFVSGNSDEDFRNISARIDKEQRDAEIMSSGGVAGLVAGAAAGMLDPTLLFPGLGQIGAITRGGRLVEGAIRGAATAAISTAAQETGLQATQLTRPWQESAMNIGQGAVFGTLLGGAAGGLTRPTLDSMARGAVNVGNFFDSELSSHLEGLRGGYGMRDLGEIPEGGFVPPAHREAFAAERDRLPEGYQISPPDETTSSYRLYSPDYKVLRRSSFPEGLADDAVEHAVRARLEPVQKTAEGTFKTDIDIGGERVTVEGPTPGSASAMAERIRIAQEEARVAAEAAPTGEAPRVDTLTEAAPAFGPDNVHPQSMAARIEELLQRGTERTPEEHAQLQELYRQRDEAELVSSQPAREAAVYGPPEAVAAEARPTPVAGERPTVVPGETPGTFRTEVEINGQTMRFTGTSEEAVAAAAQHAAQPVEGGGLGGQLGGSGGAATVLPTDIAEEEIASTLRVHNIMHKMTPEFMSSPTLSNMMSPLIETRQIGQELHEVLRLQKNVGGKLASPAAVETLIRMYKAPLAEAETFIRQKFADYRAGLAGKRRSVANIAARDLLQSRNPDGPLSFSEFSDAVGHAMRNGDKSDIPQVAEVAKFNRDKIFEPWKQRAISTGLLDKNVSTATALSYLPRLYNTEKIAAQRPAFTYRITNWLTEEQAKKDAIKTEVEYILRQLKTLTSRETRAAVQEERRGRSLRDVQMRAEEVRRLNAFAFRRSEQLSKPVDEIRAGIRRIEGEIAPHLARLEELRTAIAAEKERFPQLKEIDAALFRLIGAGQKLKQSEELVDLVRDSQGVVQAIKDVRSSIRGGIREVSQSRVAARLDLGAHELIALEKARGEIGKLIRPYTEELGRLRKEFRREMRARGGPARGGAVFETQIRGRGNVLAEQAAGRADELARIGERRAADQARIADFHNQLEQHIANWEGHTAKAAQAALKRRADNEAVRYGASMAADQPRLREADAAVMKAAQDILKHDTRLDRQDLEDIARQIIDRIVGLPGGRLPYDTMEIPASTFRRPGQEDFGPRRSALAGRKFMIPDSTLTDETLPGGNFLRNDIRRIGRQYLNTMVPDVLLTERFGRADMQNQRGIITAGYERLRKAAEEPQNRTMIDRLLGRDVAKTAENRQKWLDDWMRRDLTNLDGIRDRLRGTYALPPDPNAMTHRIWNILRDFNYLRQMGMMMIGSFPDAGHVMAHHGMIRTMREGLLPMLKDWHQFRMAREEAKLANVGTDLALDSRMMAINDVLDDYGRWSAYERGAAWASSKFGLSSLMAPWNASIRQITAVVGMRRTLEVIDKWVQDGTREWHPGSPLKKDDLTRLAELGITPDLAREIDSQFKIYGSKQAQIWWANTEAWRGEGGTTEALRNANRRASEAREAFRAAIAKETDSIIVLPGQERPLFFSRPFGRVIGQFRAFSMASAQKVMLSGLQRRDMATLNGMTMMISLGMLSYTLRTWANSDHAQPLHDPSTAGGLANYLIEGIDRAGVTGWLFDIHNMVEKATGQGIGLHRLTGGQMSRYANRGTIEAFLGPTAGLFDDILTNVGAAAKGDWKESNTHKLRGLAPTNTLIGFRHIWDAAEHGLNHALGVPERVRP